MLKHAWKCLYAEHLPLTNMHVAVIVCDLYCSKQQTQLLQHSTFFDIMFVLPCSDSLVTTVREFAAYSINDTSSQNCQNMLSMLLSLAVSVVGEETEPHERTDTEYDIEREGIVKLLQDTARWMTVGRSSPTLSPLTPVKSSPSSVLTSLLLHHFVVSHSSPFSQLNYISLEMVSKIFYGTFDHQYICPDLARVILEHSLPFLLPTGVATSFPNVLVELDNLHKASLANTVTNLLTSTPSLLLPSPILETSSPLLVETCYRFSVLQPLLDKEGWYQCTATTVHSSLMHILWESASPSLTLQPYLAQQIADLIIHQQSTAQQQQVECAVDRLTQFTQMAVRTAKSEELGGYIRILRTLPATALMTTVLAHLK